MRAETALITINGVAKLKVLLVPENEKELMFLKDALEKAENTAVSMRPEIDAAVTTNPDD